MLVVLVVCLLYWLRCVLVALFALSYLIVLWWFFYSLCIICLILVSVLAWFVVLFVYCLFTRFVFCVVDLFGYFDCLYMLLFWIVVTIRYLDTSGVLDWIVFVVDWMRLVWFWLWLICILVRLFLIVWMVCYVGYFSGVCLLCLVLCCRFDWLLC